MGCTPSKSAVIYTQDRVCRDLDTCSTFVPSLKSSASTPERPRLCANAGSGRQTFLSVPCRDVHGRSVSQSSWPESWSSAGSSSCADQCSVKPRSPIRTPDPDPDPCSDTEGCTGTA